MTLAFAFLCGIVLGALLCVVFVKEIVKMVSFTNTVAEDDPSEAWKKGIHPDDYESWQR